MNLFTLIDKQEIHLAPETKVIKSEDFSRLLDSQEIVSITKQQENDYRLQVAQECETLKEQAADAGFEEGLKRWSAQLKFLETEIKNVRSEIEKAIVPLALTAVKKIIGKELETKPETIVDVVSTALKTVLHHKRVTVYVNQQDLERVEAQKPALKNLFENLESLSFTARADVGEGGCIIETESGIINATLDSQLLALETAFKSFFQNRKKR